MAKRRDLSHTAPLAVNDHANSITATATTITAAKITA
jgi:hypothetical protein